MHYEPTSECFEFSISFTPPVNAYTPRCSKQWTFTPDSVLAAMQCFGHSHVHTKPGTFLNASVSRRFGPLSRLKACTEVWGPAPPALCVTNESRSQSLQARHTRVTLALSHVRGNEKLFETIWKTASCKASRNVFPFEGTGSGVEIVLLFWKTKFWFNVEMP